MYHQSHKGTTIIELTVVLAILGIISIGASALAINSIRANDVVWEQLITQSESRTVIHEMVNDMRKAEESSIGSYAIDTATSYEFIFYANIDDDTARERLRFWLDGDTLKRGIVEPDGNPLSYGGVEQVTEMAHHVYNTTTGNALFTYYGEEYTGVEDPLIDPIELADIRVVRIQLDLERDPNKSPVPLHVESLVSVRNLKTN